MAASTASDQVYPLIPSAYAGNVGLDISDTLLELEGEIQIPQGDMKNNIISLKRKAQAEPQRIRNLLVNLVVDQVGGSPWT